MDEATVQGVIERNMAAWEDAARRDFFGSYDSSETGNGVRFDSLGQSVVAQTLVFSARLQGAVRPYKWQITFSSDMLWSLEQDPLAHDFENIGAHEIGHAAGMGHASTTCPEETMYPYASKGEVVKRDLHVGDIAGISSLY
jgi:hypothetical protein